MSEVYCDSKIIPHVKRQLFYAVSEPTQSTICCKTTWQSSSVNNEVSLGMISFDNGYVRNVVS